MKHRPPDHAAPSTPEATPDDVVHTVDRSYLEGLVGYNARRATLTILDIFAARMAVYELRPVDFSILSLITHNPGITSRQLCTNLGVLPPNIVTMIGTLQERGLILRKPHRKDGRAMSLYLTPAGEAMMREAEITAARLEADATARLTPAERARLIKLLQKIYLPA